MNVTTKGWQTRRRRMKILAQIEIILPDLSLADLRNASRENQNQQSHTAELWQPYTDRWLCNYIRHSFSNYQDLLGELDFSHGGDLPLSTTHPQVMERLHDQLKDAVNKATIAALKEKYADKFKAIGL